MARKFAKQVGVLWAHKHQKVGNYFSGKLDLGPLGERNIAVFRNKQQDKDKKHPDYRIVLSERNGGRGADGEGQVSGDDPLPF